MNKLTFTLFAILFISFNGLASGNIEEKKGEFNLVEFALHHIGDSYSWDFFQKEDGTKVSISLPRIFLDKSNGRIDFFTNTENSLKAGYIEEHEFNKDAAYGALLLPQSKEVLEALSLQLANSDSNQQLAINNEIQANIKKFKPLDFSITKNVLFLFISSILLLFVFLRIAKIYKNNPNSAPKGIQSLFEPIIVFIRDDIGKTYIPHHYERYMPLLLNFFFFIMFLNLMGLVPFSGNVTGNIAVTASLALITVLVTNINAKKSYWLHIFWFPNVPIYVKPIMLVVELVSIFTKPFALAIRLFANITAGHIVILSFISLIFIFGKMGASPAAGWGTSVVSVIFAIFIDLIEILIALLQAYIFTTLSALFIGQAVESDH